MKAVNGKLGGTRSALRREYLLHTPDAFVRTPLPDVTKGVVVVHASPRLGAKFTAYSLELEAGGTLAPVKEQRFVWVIEGEAILTIDEAEQRLGPGGYAYLPEGFPAGLHSGPGVRAMVFEKTYEELDRLKPAKVVVGREMEVVGLALGGDEGVEVRPLLPTDAAFDFAVNTMTYAAGAALSQVEVHVMEHGLLMLEGRGMYRLGDDWHEVEAGDFIWMAPYCPQWFQAAETGPAKYLIYKDWNRRPKP